MSFVYGMVRSNAGFRAYPLEKEFKKIEEKKKVNEKIKKKKNKQKNIEQLTEHKIIVNKKENKTVLLKENKKEKIKNKQIKIQKAMQYQQILR